MFCLTKKKLKRDLFRKNDGQDNVFVFYQRDFFFWIHRKKILLVLLFEEEAFILYKKIKIHH